MQAICKCGQVHTAQFPADVCATAQYGPRVQAAMVHLNLNHAVSVKAGFIFSRHPTPKKRLLAGISPAVVVQSGQQFGYSSAQFRLRAVLAGLTGIPLDCLCCMYALLGGEDCDHAL